MPYLLTTGAEAFETDASSIIPLASHESFVDKVSILHDLEGLVTDQFQYKSILNQLSQLGYLSNCKGLHFHLCSIFAF